MKERKVFLLAVEIKREDIFPLQRTTTILKRIITKSCPRQECGEDRRLTELYERSRNIYTPPPHITKTSLKDYTIIQIIPLIATFYF